MCVFVTPQLAGYRWLMHISADALGTRFEPLVPLLGQVDAQRILNDWRLNNALKLVRPSLRRRARETCLRLRRTRLL